MSVFLHLHLSFPFATLHELPWWFPPSPPLLSSLRSDTRIPGKERRHTNCGELPPYVQDHDDGHDEGDDVHNARRALEDDGVRELDVARVAVGLDADAGRHRGDGTDGRAQRQRRRVADVGEVAEAGHRVFRMPVVGSEHWGRESNRVG